MYRKAIILKILGFTFLCALCVLFAIFFHKLLVAKAMQSYHKDHLNFAENKWSRAGLNSYKFMVEKHCFGCSGKYTVIVQDGRIVNIQKHNLNSEQNVSIPQFKTIDQYFAEIRKDIDSKPFDYAYYNSVYGHPTIISYNRDSLADGQLTIAVGELTAL